MLKYFLVSFFCIVSVLPTDLFSQDAWKTDWSDLVAKVDSMYYREKRQFRLMQTYQNEATQELILKDIDSLNVFGPDVNEHIEMCNSFIFPQHADALNASETLKLKIDVLLEYYDQCRLQIHVNNKVLQRKLKNESLDFKVSEIDGFKFKQYVPILN